MIRRATEKARELIRFRVFLPLIAAQERANDRRHKIDTEAMIPVADLGFRAGTANHYEATPTRHVRKILPRLNLNANDVLVDFGSGKGRVLLEAARYKIAKVIGVELSPQLAALCEANIAAMRPHLKCGEARVAVCNAAEWAVPDEATVVFFFNPFPEAVFKEVVDRIRESLARRPRMIRGAFYNLKYRHVLDGIPECAFREEIVWQNFGLYRSTVHFFEFHSADASRGN